ncbi:DUF2637 domain-containing protein [Streptomyces buecherae]|uniref:DUF2637 domain-containing protein n=1 Tax=Streptomyces buecherae TaxID=2763006 RepID=UPI0033E22B28
MADHQPTHAPPHPAPDHTAGLGLAIGAALIITAITAIAFWLSYHHLHDVAAAHGLAADSRRAWAWPAVLDLFYLAGELLILRASYLRTVDPWAIALTAVGALGSIGLNVAGVGPGAPVLEYVVAAVPPVAALLAFGALMRQLHAWFALAEETAVVAPSTSVNASAVSRSTAVSAPVTPPGPMPPTAPPTLVTPAAPPAPAPIAYSDPRCTAVRALYNTGHRPGTAAMRDALAAAGFGRVSDSTIRGQIRAEVERHEPHLAQLPPALRTA